MSTVDFQIKGDKEVRKMLANYREPQNRKRLQAGTKAGAAVFKAPLKAEARQVSKRLAQSVSARKAKKQLPATVITFRPKIAYFRAWVLLGTKAHGPRRAPFLNFIPGWNKYKGTARPDGPWKAVLSVRGVRANPITARVAARYQQAAYEACDRELAKEV